MRPRLIEKKKKNIKNNHFKWNRSILIPIALQNITAQKFLQNLRSDVVDLSLEIRKNKIMQVICYKLNVAY